MELSDYLSELKKCPDNKLQIRCGLKDNEPILLKTEYRDFMDHLKSCGLYTHSEEREEDKGMNNIFHSNDGGVTLQVRNHMSRYYTIGMGFEFNLVEEWEKEEFERDMDYYTMYIVLHPSRDKNIPYDTRMRALANVVDDIGTYAINEGIPLCMPHAIAEKYIYDHDRSRLVCHVPLDNNDNNSGDM